MVKINIENKAYGELGVELGFAELATAVDMRKALVHGTRMVEGVAMKLANIERSVENGEVRKALDLVVASGHGDLLREGVVQVQVNASDTEWSDDGLLLECGGYLSVYCVNADKVYDVLEPSDIADSDYGLHDVADMVERVRLFLDCDGDVDESEMHNADGNAWCKYEQAWDGDEADEDYDYGDDA